MIHPTAIVHPNAEIDVSVNIGPYTLIGESTTIGAGTVIGPHVVIDPYVTIGPQCHVFQYATLGAPPQSVKYKGEQTVVKIGRGTIIREFVTVHRGTEEGGGITSVGEDCFIMAYAHVAHDCRIGRNVILANYVGLSGHIEVGNYASLGGMVAVHQFVRIGEHAFIGGASGVSKDIPPYVMAAGPRVKLHGLNRQGLRNHGFSELTISSLKKAYQIVFRKKLTLSNAIERILKEVEPLPEVNKFIQFLKSSQRGIAR